MMTESSDILFDVKNLTKHFPFNTVGFGRNKSIVKAVNSLNFTIKKGESFALVGESGCGKSTTGKMLIRLMKPTEGSVFYEGVDIIPIRGAKLRQFRRDMQIIFQDPYSSLDPRMTCELIIEEPLIIHTKMTRMERRERVSELLDLVGLPAEYALRYPHEFSGGQRQRIGIARALALSPKFIVCDEPVSALDVSVQSQVLNLIKELQQKLNLTYLFIAHGMNVVKYISDRIGVMYLGSIVELAESDTLYHNPLHPYTQSLISAIPDIDRPQNQERIILKGDIPSPADIPNGCPFHTRCSRVMAICRQVKPQEAEIEEGHFLSCHLYQPLAKKP